MDTKNELGLKDESLFPDDEVLSLALGKSFPAYEAMIDLFNKNELVHEWRYYKDGKAWLCKVQKKKKTIEAVSSMLESEADTFFMASQVDWSDAGVAIALKGVVKKMSTIIRSRMKAISLLKKPAGSSLPATTSFFNSIGFHKNRGIYKFYQC